MEENVNIEEKKSIKDKFVDFARDNKSKIVKGVAVVGGTLAGAGLLGFLFSRGNNVDEYDEYYDEYEEIVDEYDPDDDEDESDEEDSDEDE